MGVVQAGRCFYLAEKPLASKAGSQFRAEDLDGNAAFVPYVVRQVHRCHATGTDLALNGVATGEGSCESTERAGH